MLNASNISQEDTSFYLPSELKFDDNLILQNLFSRIFNSNSADLLGDYKNFNQLLLLHRSFLRLSKLPQNDYIILLKIHLLLEIKKINFFEEKSTSSSTASAYLPTLSNVSNVPTLTNSKFSSKKEKEKDSVSYQILNTVNSVNSVNTVNTVNTVNSSTKENSSPDSINSANKLSNSECNEIGYEIYSLLFDENTNEIKLNLLDCLIQIILGEYIGINLCTFEKLMNLIDGNGSINVNESSSTGAVIKPLFIPRVSFEIFLKYFKILIFFYFYSKNYQNVFNILDHDYKLKILTAELIVTLNKITRNLEENNIFLIFSKKFLGLLDNNQIYLSKLEYYSILIKALSL